MNSHRYSNIPFFLGFGIWNLEFVCIQLGFGKINFCN
jgi:hypothetical protein